MASRGRSRRQLVDMKSYVESYNETEIDTVGLCLMDFIDYIDLR